jgi:hypothetical protein
LEGIACRFEGGLSIAPEVAVGDGALGFWKALDETFPSTRRQRCWLHKTLNVLDKFPKSVQPNAHKDLHEIWLAPDRATAETAIAAFAQSLAALVLLDPCEPRRLVLEAPSFDASRAPGSSGMTAHIKSAQSSAASGATGNAFMASIDEVPL